MTKGNFSSRNCQLLWFNERENKFGGREETQLLRLQKCHAKSLSFSVIPGFPRLYQLYKLIYIQQCKHICGGGIQLACDISIFGDDRFIINRWAIFIVCFHVAQIPLLLFTNYTQAKPVLLSVFQCSREIDPHFFGILSLWGGGYINNITCIYFDASAL